MQTFSKGDAIPTDWYTAPNLKPLVFMTPVETEVVDGERHIWPTRQMEPGEYVVYGEGPIDPKQDSPLRSDPPWMVHAAPRGEK